MSKKRHKAIYIITKSIYKYQSKMLGLLVNKAKAQFAGKTTDVLDNRIDKYQRICTDLALIKSAVKTAQDENLIKVKVLGSKVDQSMMYKEVFNSLEKAGFYIDGDWDNTVFLTWK